MAMAMATLPGIPSNFMDFVQRFQNLQQQQNTSDELIKDLLIYCDGVEKGLRHDNDLLAKRLMEVQLDLEDAIRSRRDLQTKLTDANQRLGQANVDVDNMKNRSPYIMVLLDGDGMIFHDALIRNGIEGGKQAATQLRNAILENYPDATDQWEIMVKVCTNITGLSKVMARSGAIGNPEDFKDFTLGFTQGKASFDYIDVGHGKERADSKLKECMRWHLRNQNCKHMFLGISHDAGYAPFLDEVVKTDDRDRITILEGPPAVRELRATGLHILNLTNIFRAEKLVDRAPPSWAGVTSVPPTVPVPVASPNASPVVKTSTTTVKRGSPVPALTPTKPNWTPQPRGLDPTILVNPLVLDKIKRRTTTNKLCNNHYLRGPCSKGDDCCFEHNYKINDDEYNAIAFLTRLNPCDSGQECELEFCIYGHHCPSVSTDSSGKNPVCDAFGCRFAKEDHPPGTVIKRPRKEREYY